MNTILIWLHEFRHGAAWVEIQPRGSGSRKHGVVVTCDVCGKRWLSRAPWYRRSL